MILFLSFLILLPYIIVIIPLQHYEQGADELMKK